LPILIQAFSDIDVPARRVAAIKALKPFLEEENSPSIILRTAAMGLAKLKKDELKKADLGNLRPEAMLKEAIARNPYDLVAYRGLSQVYAARGAYEKSWDMSDGLRAFQNVPEELTISSNRAEAQILRAAPGFFPPIYP
ncbi:MAG: hypothetical protein ACPGVT_12440, partial [Maricaulaceae bacterium]